jgi:hypothetical protein
VSSTRLNTQGCWFAFPVPPNPLCVMFVRLAALPFVFPLRSLLSLPVCLMSIFSLFTCLVTVFPLFTCLVTLFSLFTRAGCGILIRELLSVLLAHVRVHPTASLSYCACGQCYKSSCNGSGHLRLDRYFHILPFASSPNRPMQWRLSFMAKAIALDRRV